MKRVACLLLLLCALACGGCDNSSSTQGDVAQLRFLQASPDAPSVDVLVDSLLVLSGLSFGESSDYITVDEGARRIRVSQAADPNPFIDVNYTLISGNDYTFVLANNMGQIDALLLEDNSSEPDFGKFKLRFLQAAPSLPLVDVYLVDQNESLADLTPEAARVPFEGVVDYIGFSEGTYSLQLTTPRTKHVVFDSGPLPFKARQIRTIVVVDAPGGGLPFRAILLEDHNT